VPEWSVLIETRAAPGKRGSLDQFDSRLGDFSGALRPWGGAVGGNHHGWDARVAVKGKDALAAVTRAHDLVMLHAQQCRLPLWPVERIEILEWEAFEAELETPNFPDLVGAGEVLVILNISKQRLSQLRTAGDFPEPIATLSGVPIWLRMTIEAFGEHRNVTPRTRPWPLHWAHLGDEITLIRATPDPSAPGLWYIGVWTGPEEAAPETHIGRVENARALAVELDFVEAHIVNLDEYRWGPRVR
jgi:hypothetical protein